MRFMLPGRIVFGIGEKAEELFDGETAGREEMTMRHPFIKTTKCRQRDGGNGRKRDDRTARLPDFKR